MDSIFYADMTQTTYILLLEDDINLSTVLADYLRSKGYAVDTAMDGKEGWEMLSHKHYDILLTDIMMPRMNGLQVLKNLRESNNPIPVIIVSAKNDREDIIKGYNLGCDDYVTKPFRMMELLSRIRALLRTSRSQVSTTLSRSGVEVDQEHMQVRKNGEPLQLTLTEYRILLALIQRNTIVP